MRTRVLLALTTLIVLTAFSLFWVLMLFRPAGSLPLSTGENLLVNADFEGPFVPDPACGLVADGWGCFTVGNHTVFIAQPETWAPAVRSGHQAQLLGILTPDPGAPTDRAFGLYQTVNVVPSATYTLVLRGLIRADDDDPDPWRYQVEWGYDPHGSTDWRAVSSWYEVPWYRYDPREHPGPYLEYRQTFTPTGERLTLFVRLRVKWGTWPREVILNLDDLALLGPRLRPRLPAAGSTPTPTPSLSSGQAEVMTPTLVVSATAVTTATASGPCAGPNMLANGDFEGEFLPTGVAEGWQPFSEGGPASFGFWDAGAGGEEDAHGQVIAINLMGLPPGEGELGAGITQTVKNLEPGGVYQVCIRGKARVAGASEHEQAALTVEWGVGTGDVLAWSPIPWSAGGTARGVMTYTARFTATAPAHVLGIRLREPATSAAPEAVLVLRDVHLTRVGGCTYTVRQGDTLSRIARRYHTTVAHLARRNHLPNPNLIRTGQRLEVPCVAGAP